MAHGPHNPSFLRRAAGTTALWVVGIPMIVIGMLLVFSIVAYDTVERRFRRPRQPWARTAITYTIFRTFRIDGFF